MPGVPNGRGCDACRQVKKKCDLVKPSCGRCRRLMIACVGAGVLRWKFKHQQMQRSSPATFSQAIVVRHGMEAPIPANLTGSHARTANRLMSIWAVDDLRYDISIFGDYFRWIPRRLGESEALDAAVWAFACSHSTTYNKQVSMEALAAYGMALRKVKDAIEDPEQRSSPNLLCALQLMGTCQAWISTPEDIFANHSIVLGHLLPDMIDQNPSDPWERFQLIIGAMIVIVSATFSSQMPFDEIRLAKVLKPWSSPRPHTDGEGRPLPSFEIYFLMHVPIWTRAPEQHIQEMYAAYDQIKSDLAALQKRIAKLKPSLDVTDNDHDVDKLAEQLAARVNISMPKLRAQFQAACTLLLAVLVLLNGLIRAVNDPQGSDLQLAAEALCLTDDVIQLGEDILYMAPVYSSGITMTFVIAWGADTRPTKRKRIEELMSAHKLRSIGEEWKNGGGWLEHYLARLRASAISRSSGPSANPSMQESNEIEDCFAEAEQHHPVGRCTIL